MIKESFSAKVKTPREVLEEWVAALMPATLLAPRRSIMKTRQTSKSPRAPPVLGQAKIKEDLTTFFTAFPDSVTHVENLFEAGEWAILEWSGGATWQGEFAGMRPNGKTFTLRGCGFFHVVHGKSAAPGTGQPG